MRFRRRPAGRNPRIKRAPGPPAPAPPVAQTYRDRNRAAEETPKRNLGWGWLQRLGLIIILVAVLASLVNILSLSSVANVVQLSNSSSQPLLQPKAVYAQAASRALSRSAWNHNKITFNADQLSQQMLAQFPELTAVSVTIPLLAHQPVVYVEPAQPALILVANNGAFIIGSTGKALLAAQAPADFNQPRLPVVTDQSGFQAQLNHPALAGKSVQFIQMVAAELAAKQYTVSGLDLPPGSSQLNAHISGQPYIIKFNLQSSDPRGEAGTFLATINQLHHRNITPASYVDVRVDGRAYYK